MKLSLLYLNVQNIFVDLMFKNRSSYRSIPSAIEKIALFYYTYCMKNSFANEATTVLNHKWNSAIKREIPIYTRDNSIRSDFDRDYTRLLHCQAYSRLKHKTQVFYSPHNDHVCTRMEHVLHVASVAGTIAKYLGLNQELTQAIAIGHDIGHAPFGHTGEDILNSLMEKRPGANAPKKFWHERNSLFFADYIETLNDPNGTEKTLNLTYAVRDGLICHCGEIDQQGIKPRENAMNLYDIKVPGVVQPFTWEGCVVKVSDKIAFLGRDLQDARAYHILDMGCYRQLREIVASTLGLTKNGETISHSSGKAVNTTVLINDMVVDLCEQSLPEMGLCFSEQYFKFIKELKKFSYEKVYTHWRLLEFKSYAKNVLKTIFTVLMETQNFAKNGRLPFALRNFPKLCSTFEDWLIRYSNYIPTGSSKNKTSLNYQTPSVFDVNDFESYEKCVIEYISGMTDNFAIACYEEIITF
ncbi:deoxyguanosinetriphosphate triphosphohydrolase family protein [Treponema pectinovorum]|uniref:deoxyguanosinetriphosphate triphosphohydrolase family protein n=1 Tax=Treponema pectinovorum TaxID=164 RepID=UPI0020916486|nr:dNTP triphosphohydrolase [Treponema pectinovorum]